MIGSLETRLEAAIQNHEMIDAMLRGTAAFAQYKERLPFVTQSYTRTLLVKRPDFELVAMQWAPGSVSELHDHGDARCWVAVVEGTIDVENFERRDRSVMGPHAELKFTESIRVATGDVDYRLNRRELHRVRNTAECSAYSLQIYSPMLSQYRVFDEQTGFGRTALAYYDSMVKL
ncbi:MAG: cysteine dioxygenase family protein [Candidatus Eremiobacteraeota bacterium]|nr:cysteine dioxygenase family protein [Candidatus Eremiobacteraeota bacterium]